MRRFEQEAQAAAALNHPNIATIHEIAEDEETHFIAMEFVDGVTKPPRKRAAFYSIADNRIDKVFDVPQSAGNWKVIDEHTLMYSKNEGGADGIWTQPIDGGPAKQLIRFGSQQIWGYATQDSKHFAVVRGTGSTDLVLIKIFR